MKEETRMVHISFAELQKSKLLLMNKTQDKFTFIQGMKKSEILMKKRPKIVHIHSANEEEKTPDEEEEETR
jgi:hypothetical protein